jgi:hypothetical protein
MPLAQWMANHILENYVSVQGISVHNCDDDDENETTIRFSMAGNERGTIKLLKHKDENDEREFIIEIIYNSKNDPCAHQKMEITEEKYNELLAIMKTIMKGYIN